MRSRPRHPVHRVVRAYGRPLPVGFGCGRGSHSRRRRMGGPDGRRLPRTTAKIVLNIRLIKAVVALLAGAALSVSGLQMQTLFRNPLAGPYVLASARVQASAWRSWCWQASGSSIGIAGAAWLGAAVVLLVIAAVGHRIKDIMVILILGMMFSSGVSAVVQILQYLSKEEALKAFVIWTMGSLGDVTVPQLAILLPSVIVGLLLAVWTIKPLNLLLFGEEYAVTMGLNIRRSRRSAVSLDDAAGRHGNGFLRPDRLHRSCHASRRADALPRGRPPRAPAGNPSLGGGGIASLRYRFQNVHFAVNAITALLGIPIVVWVVLRNKSMTV